MGYYTNWRGGLEMTKTPSDEVSKMINDTYWIYHPFYTDGEYVTCHEDSSKTYHWEENLISLLKLLKENDIYANGDFTWEGEEHDDFGKVLVENSNILICEGQHSYKEPVPIEKWRGR